MRRKKVKIKGTLSKEEKKRIDKVLKKYGDRQGFYYIDYSNKEKTYLYE